MRLAPILLVAAALALPAAASASVIDYSCTPAPASCLGWYHAPVTIRWSVAGTKAPGTCIDTTVAAETAGSPQYCEVTGAASTTVLLKLDMTAPTVTAATPARPPDHGGWYRSPVRVAWSGTDALSGLVGCSAITYSSATAGPVNLVGRCQDRAGNVSRPLTLGLRYDAVPPSLASFRALPGDRAVRLRWRVAGATSVKVLRNGHRLKTGSGTVLDRRVRNGRSYTYEVLATDQAGNVASRRLKVVPGPRLVAPGAAATLLGAPLLRWTRVRGADYYNVQLFRGHRKILSAWPSRPRLKLSRSWAFAGARHRLERGRRYRWYVWPGHGNRAAADYGRLIGTRTFTLRAP